MEALRSQTCRADFPNSCKALIISTLFLIGIMQIQSLTSRMFQRLQLYSSTCKRIQPSRWSKQAERYRSNFIQAPKPNSHEFWLENEQQVGADDVSDDFSNKGRFGILHEKNLLWKIPTKEMKRWVIKWRYLTHLSNITQAIMSHILTRNKSHILRDIEEIKRTALKSEKAIEEDNSQKQSTPLIVEEILIPKSVKEECRQNIKMEDLLDNDFVCAEIEVCLKGDKVHETNIFNGDKNIPDEVKNVSDIGHLEKNDDCEVENNVVVEVEELKSMKPSKFSVDLNENFDSSMVCVNSVVSRVGKNEERKLEEQEKRNLEQFCQSPHA
ncbi:hypothetical protein PIB30_063063 [Stylosanthes scabra]|uniref:Uncharacterized protein n=1 Tax=Stylosanthes scabra TaxID=79078 RepID=A0ABU6QLR1_9FABA|nr:hypothetical protein [Stylosanthes scabra]